MDTCRISPPVVRDVHLLSHFSISMPKKTTVLNTNAINNSARERAAAPKSAGEKEYM